MTDLDANFRLESQTGQKYFQFSFHLFPVIGNEHNAKQPLHVGANDSRDNLRLELAREFSNGLRGFKPFSQQVSEGG